MLDTADSLYKSAEDAANSVQQKLQRLKPQRKTMSYRVCPSDSRAFYGRSCNWQRLRGRPLWTG